jgi:hypothetical protein
LQATLRRRYTKNLTYGVVYTWSKAMDYTDSDTGLISNVVDPRVWNYGKAGYEIQRCRAADQCHVRAIHGGCLPARDAVGDPADLLTNAALLKMTAPR